MRKRSDTRTRWSSRRQPKQYGGAVNRRGSDNYAAKLSEADVMRAKQAFAKGATVGELARKYDVHASTMSRALRGLTFGHVRAAKKGATKKAAAKRRR